MTRGGPALGRPDPQTSALRPPEGHAARWGLIHRVEAKGSCVLTTLKVVPVAGPVTVIALVTIAEDNPMALAEYFRVTGPLLERAGARITKRFQVNEAVVGGAPAQSVLMVEYPSRAAVDMVFGSPEYQSIIPVRNKAFLTYQVSIVSE